MGNRIYYRREINVGFLIGDKNNFYAFNNTSGREIIDKIISDVVTMIPPRTAGNEAGREAMALMVGHDFHSYLRTPPWQIEADEKKNMHHKLEGSICLRDK